MRTPRPFPQENVEHVRELTPPVKNGPILSV